MTTRTILDVLNDLSDEERSVLQDIISLERERLAVSLDHDMPEQIVKSLGSRIK
jgi:hypothetical protein